MRPRRTRLVPLVTLLLAASATGQLDLPAKPIRPGPQPGIELPPAPGQRGDLAPRGNEVPLELPAGKAPSAVAPGPAPALAGPEESARILFRDLARARETRLAAPALERLLALGPLMLPVARAELGGAHAPSLLAAGRACLIGGAGDDRAAVSERLTRALPAECAAPLLEELLARDPVLASPEYLCALLAHPTPAMRAAAARALEPRLASAHLAALGSVFSSQRTVARSAALELVARVDDPLAWNLLASRLGDPNAQLAQRAAELLAAFDAGEPLLLERAFPALADPAAWDRARAYAVLALIQREDARQNVLLDERHVEALRGGLASGQPLFAGVSAIALARVGFRSSAARAGPWLARDVPHQLVRSGTGAEFHSDFSALEGPALRALALLSGEDFGQDGEAWRRWWIDHADGFRARHAVIELPPDAAAQLLVDFPDRDGRARAVLGPLRPLPRDSGPVLRLDAGAAERLLARLAELGVFGPEHLPRRGAAGTPELLIAVGDQEKRFALGPTPEPWLAELLVELAELARENLWQLYFDPAATSAYEWWRSEQERFAGLAPLERQREVKALLLAALRRLSGEQRDGPLVELRELYRVPGVAAPEDFEPLLATLAGEPVFGPRAEELCELARIAAAGSDPSAAERLLTLGLERFGPEADTALARVARDLEPATLRSLAADPRARVRALAVGGLARTSAEHAVLRTLLADPEPAVRLAVLATLGETPVEEARPELLAAARAGSGEERLAALRALARLGGKDVQDMAMEAIGDPDPAVQAAGVAVLADLADPGSASLLAALLARGPASPLFPAARRGLKRLGAAGIDECMRLAGASNVRTRREAALLLAEALVPDAAGMLLTLLTEDPGDTRVTWELSVLSGLDLAAEERPESAGWAWWDLVVHDDPTAWLCAAAERAGVPAPARESLGETLTAEGARFLLALTELEAPHLVERATRELERRLASEFPRPATVTEWSHLRAELVEAVRARLGE